MVVAPENQLKEPVLLLNGQPASSIDILDRGLHYGDGVFETIAVIDNRPLCWDAHIARLISGCAKLKINFNDTGILESEMLSICERVSCAVLKIIITSGSGGRGYQRYRTSPNRLLALYPWPDYPEDYTTHGAKVHLCSTRLGHHPSLSGIKHLNRLEQVLARNEWHDTEIMEGLMLDLDGNVIEGTMSNLFVVHSNKKLLTSDISLCGIDGIVRQYILDHCTDFGYQSEILNLSLKDIYSADEIFFCNSIMGILPVSGLAEHIFSSQLIAHKIKNILIAQGIIAAL